MFIKLFGRTNASLVTNPVVFEDRNGDVHLNLALSFGDVAEAKSFLVENNLPTVVFDGK